MNFSIAATTRRLLFPKHELSCSWFLWWHLVRKLRERGRAATRESGAFLLGTRVDGRARIVDFVLYDDLDPHCLDTGIVRFDGRYYAALWTYVERTGRSVVADVHVHPGEALQSESDRKHPMIAQAGHVALILPRFGRPPMTPSNARAYRFESHDEWHAVPAPETSTFFHVGLWP
jgi:proteasome lid subunit RPN8/RPN11